MPAVLEFGINEAPVFSGVAKIEQRLQKMDDSVRAAQTKLASALKNPWASAGVDVQKYGNELLRAERQARQLAAAHAKLASYKGPQAAAAANPWAAGAPQWAAQAEMQKLEEKRIREENHRITMQEQRMRARISAQQAADAAALAGGTGIISGNAALRNQAALAARYKGLLQSGRGGGGGGRFAIGNAAMQAQDIAVQLEMGTSAARVFTQQGSQLLGAFGVGGAILGGIGAIGGALYSMKGKAVESFDAAKKSAADFAGQLNSALTGTSVEITAFWGTMNAGIETHLDDMQRLQQGWSGIGARLTEALGGPGVQAQIDLANKQQLEKVWAQEKIRAALLNSSATEVEIAKARATGNDAHAEALERQLSLKKELAGIDASNLPADIKARLSADARARIEGTEIAKKATTEKRTAEERKKTLKDLQRQSADIARDMLPDDQRLASLKKSLGSILTDVAERNMGAYHTTSGVSGIKTLSDSYAAAGRDTAAINTQRQYQEALLLQKEILDTQKQINQAQEQAVQAAKQKRFATLDEMRADVSAAKQKRFDFLDQIKAINDEKAARAQAMQDALREIEIIRLRTAGREKEAAALERQMQIEARARDLQQRLGIDAAKAGQMAAAMTPDERQRDGRIRSRRDGSTLARLSDTSGAWGEANARRDFRWNEASAARDAAWARTRHHQSMSRYDALQQGASTYDRLQGRNAQNAAAGDRGTVNLGTKEIELLSKMAEGMISFINLVS